MARSLAVLVVFVVGCGRSEIGDDVVPLGALTVDAGALDAGSLDGGPRDAGVMDAGVLPAALSIFVADQRCPVAGAEASLKPRANEQLLLVKTTVEQECSGAGGDWLLGTLLDGSQVAFGAHACFFVPASLPRSSFGLVRLAAPGATQTTPVGWCILPVTWNREVLAWGIYPDELAANRVRAALLSP